MNNENLVKIFKAVSNERRFLILKHLFRAKELSVGQISELIHLSLKSTSRHLSVLYNARLVSVRQVNLNRFYSVSSSNFPKEFTKFFTS